MIVPAAQAMSRLDGADWWIVLVAPVAFAGILVAVLLALDAVPTPRRAPSATPPAWDATRAGVLYAIAARDVAEAGRAWDIAHAVAIASHDWAVMLEVGHLALRLGDAGAMRGAAERARECYLIALFRARRDGRLDGVLRSAEALADVGDASSAGEALRVAAGLAAHAEPEARDAYRRTAERLRSAR